MECVAWLVFTLPPFGIQKEGKIPFPPSTKDEFQPWSQTTIPKLLSSKNRNLIMFLKKKVGRKYLERKQQHQKALTSSTALGDQHSQFITATTITKVTSTSTTVNPNRISLLLDLQKKDEEKKKIFFHNKYFKKAFQGLLCTERWTPELKSNTQPRQC